MCLCVTFTGHIHFQVQRIKAKLSWEPRTVADLDYRRGGISLFEDVNAFCELQRRSCTMTGHFLSQNAATWPECSSTWSSFLKLRRQIQKWKSFSNAISMPRCIFCVRMSFPNLDFSIWFPNFISLSYHPTSNFIFNYLGNEVSKWSYEMS